MDDDERRLWIENDEGLYQWWQSSHLGIYRFIKENRKEITDLINRKETENEIQEKEV